MAILRWDSVNHLFIVADRRSRLFEYALSQLNVDIRIPSPWTPPCDVYENDDGFVLKAETSGLKLEDLAVEALGQTVTIVGKRGKREETGDARYFLLERSYGRFIRTFSLPAAIDEDKVSAGLKDGLLTVTLPKKKVTKGKKVTIKVE